MPKQNSFSDFEVKHRFEKIGDRTLLLNGRRIQNQDLILLAMKDVTDQLLAKEKIRNSALFPEENPSPVLRVSAEGKLIYANPSAAALLKIWACNVGEPVPDSLRQEVAVALHTSSVRKLSARCNQREFSFTLVPINKHNYVNFYGFEITEAKQAKAALKRTKNRYQELVENANSAIIRWKADGTLTFFNEKAQQLFGYRAEEVIGKHVGILISDQDDTSDARSSLPQHITQKPEMYENFINQNLCSYGRKIWIAWTNRPMYDADGKVKEILAIGSDISDRVEAEERIQESEKRFRDLADAMPQLVWSASAEGAVDYCNHRYQEFRGLVRKPDGTWDWLTTLHPEDRDRTMQAWQVAVSQGADFQMEHRAEGPDGDYAWYLTRAIPVRAANGQIVRWYGTSTEIDDLKRTQRALNEARQAAEAANQAKSEFLATMSHEIRTPMTITLSALELLQDSGLAGEQGKLLEMAQTASKALLDLINDILDISRIEARKLELHRESGKIRPCLEGALNMFVNPASEKDLELTLEVAEDVPEIGIFDFKRLHQVLVNLLSNAVKFTEGGTIALQTKVEENNLHVAIRDTGPGIPRSQLERLFDSFTQLDSSISRQHGGSGLGLAISRGLVELMGGRLWAESREGEGSVFQFTLPLTSIQAPAEERTGKGPDHAIDLFSPLDAHVLVAEDDPRIRQLITRILKKWGCTVLTAGCGEEAVQIWRTHRDKIDLILMDLQMPRLDGLQATRHIRGMGAHSDVPIIALTAHARKADQKSCLDAGMNAWITKPIDSHKLQAIMLYLLMDKKN